VDKAIADPVLWIDGVAHYAELTGWYWGDEEATIADVGDMTFPAGYDFFSEASSGHRPIHELGMNGDFAYPVFGFLYQPFYWQEIWWHKGLTWDSNY
jgi:hypothetical protein